MTGGAFGPGEGGCRPTRLSLRLFAGRPAALGAKPDLLGQRSTLLRIIGSYHRIVAAEAPLLAVFVGSHLIMRHQMPLEHLQLLPVFQTNDIVGLDRGTDRHRRFRLRLGLLLARAQRVERVVDILDQHWKVVHRDAVVADMSRYDVGGQGDQGLPKIVVFHDDTLSPIRVWSLCSRYRMICFGSFYKLIILEAQVRLAEPR